MYSPRGLILVPLLVVLGMLLYPVGASAAASLSRVIITDPTNTSQQAHVDASGNVQVGGTVNVGNSPTVNAQQSGTWAVGITGTPSVNDLSDPERQAVQVQKRGTIDPGADFGATNALEGVPANKRLVITNVSAQVQIPTGEHVVELGIISSSAEQFFVPTFLGTSAVGTDFWALNSPTTFVVNAGDSVAGLALRDSAGSTGTIFDITVSGYLIDCTTNLPCN